MLVFIGIPYLQYFLIPRMTCGMGRDVCDRSRLADWIHAHHKVLDIASQDRSVDDLCRLQHKM